jgi:hypothetical protein
MPVIEILPAIDPRPTIRPTIFMNRRIGELCRRFVLDSFVFCGPLADVPGMPCQCKNLSRGSSLYTIMEHDMSTRIAVVLGQL